MTNVQKKDFLAALNLGRNAELYKMSDIHSHRLPILNQAVIMYTKEGSTLLGEYRWGKFYKDDVYDGRFQGTSELNNVIAWVSCK